MLGIVIYSKKVYRLPTILRWPSYVLRKCRETRRRRNRTSQKSVSLRSAPRVHTRYPIFLWEEVLGIVTTTTSARTKEYRLGTNAWCINVCVGMWVLYIFMKYIVHSTYSQNNPGKYLNMVAVYSLCSTNKSTNIILKYYNLPISRL